MKWPVFSLCLAKGRARQPKPSSPHQTKVRCRWEWLGFVSNQLLLLLKWKAANIRTSFIMENSHSQLLETMLLCYNALSGDLRREKMMITPHHTYGFFLILLSPLLPTTDPLCVSVLVAGLAELASRKYKLAAKCFLQASFDHCDCPEVGVAPFSLFGSAVTSVVGLF